jgi:hypothetical protein
LLATACGGSGRVATPVETFKTYIKASKQKDTKAMKLLLSASTIKMHEQQAKAQGVSVDEIIKRETLIGETQTGVDYKDEKIEGDKATLEFKNSSSKWETMPFVREDGVWKIDKQGYADRMLQEIEREQDQKFEDANGAVPPPNQE